MQAAISICGAGALGIYMAVAANKSEGYKIKLHSMRKEVGDRQIKLNTTSEFSSREIVKVREVKNLCNVIFLACDVGRVEKYISEIQKDRRGRSTLIYLLQNGLISTGEERQASNLMFKRISIGGVSLKLVREQMICQGRSRPLLEISKSGVFEAGIYADIVLSTLKVIGDVKIRAKEDEVVWNKLVKSGPHFIDSLLEFEESIQIGSNERLNIARRIFQEYWDVAAIACGNQLQSKKYSLDLLENLISNRVINSGARRYILEESHEEYEAIVGRVKKYALLQGLDVTTLSLVELATRKH